MWNSNWKEKQKNSFTVLQFYESKSQSDKLPANLGYLYENLVAQMIAASGRELFYYTWEKNGSTHYYEAILFYPVSNMI